MPQNQETIKAGPNAYVEMTAGDADEMTFQAIDAPDGLFIRFTDDATPPAGNLPGYRYHNLQGEKKVVFADMKPSGTPKRAWLRSAGAAIATVIVDHADAA